MNKKVAIIDYGINNISSILKIFKKTEIEANIITEQEKLDNYKYIILPGVGSFDYGMKNLEAKGFKDKILQLYKKGNFLLGICLGMQLFLQKSEESENETMGLSIFKGNCKKIKNLEDRSIQSPHIGWNNLEIKKNCQLTENLENNFDGYFVHSYFVDLEEKNQIIATTKHGVEFPSIIKNENIYGIQCHPEKCLKNGIKILKNFTDSN
jgi:glutamine amidotransferase|tara:strand:- start:646 stop:1272 length:627 start_codon:yes stop_codon:yes gene_type:complete